MERARLTKAQLVCLVECALGLLAVIRKHRKNAKSRHAYLFGSITSKYVIAASSRMGWMAISTTPKVYYQGRLTVYPYELTEAGSEILAKAVYPLGLLAQKKLTAKEAAAVLGVSRSRVAQMISSGLLHSEMIDGKGYIKTNELYVVWRVWRWKNIRLTPLP